MTTAQINGYLMHYVDRGKGIPILFIHPPVLTSVNFMYQTKGLSTDFRTIAFDIRGHGKSKPSRREVTYPLIVEDIRQLMNHLRIDRSFLCGYSTGGSIVLEFLLTHPDRAHGGIIIGGMSEANNWRLRNKISAGAALSKMGAVGTIAFANAWSQAEKLSVFWKLFVDAKKGYAENAEQYYRYSLDYNCTSRLGQIHHPVLLFYGEQDKNFHPHAYLLHRRLPKNELVFIRNVDHRIPTKSPRSLNKRIKQFIDRYS